MKIALTESLIEGDKQPPHLRATPLGKCYLGAGGDCGTVIKSAHITKMFDSSGLNPLFYEDY